MSAECPACEQALREEPIPRWKAPLLFVGALLFCPCHLPATFAALAAVGGALGGAAWFFGNQVLVYSAFSLFYLVFLVLLARWFLGQRDRERHAERLHASHPTQA